MEAMRTALSRSAGLTLLLGLALPLSSCARLFPDPRPSFVLIVIDTLRADYLGCYGFDGEISPNIDALARESLVFERCSSQAPWTTPSVASMMTSLLPDLYGVMLPEDAPRDHREWRRQWNPAIPGAAETLAERLRGEGYRTGAFVANPFLVSGLGFDQGFEIFDTRRARASDRTADRLVEDSAGWLDEALGGNAPFFFYLHLMDVHGPYTAHERHYAAVRGSPGLQGDGHRLSNDEYDRIQPYLRAPPWARQPRGRFVHEWRARYSAGVHAADRRIGRLLDTLRAHRRWSKTVVVVTSDHGEELFDHGGWDHGFSLYQHQIHVPLIIRNPAAPQFARRVDDQVGLVDLMPTLVTVAGAEVPAGLAGRNLFGPRAPAPRPLFASCNKDRPDEAAVVVGPLKLIVDLEVGSRRVFDLDDDPKELAEITTPAAPEIQELQRVLERMAAARKSSAAGSQPILELSDEQLERLRELGYVDPPADLTISRREVREMP